MSQNSFEDGNFDETLYPVSTRAQQEVKDRFPLSCKQMQDNQLSDVKLMKTVKKLIDKRRRNIPTRKLKRSNWYTRMGKFWCHRRRDLACWIGIINISSTREYNECTALSRSTTPGRGRSRIAKSTVKVVNGVNCQRKLTNKKLVCSRRRKENWRNGCASTSTCGARKRLTTWTDLPTRSTWWQWSTQWRDGLNVNNCTAHCPPIGVNKY